MNAMMMQPAQNTAEAAPGALRTVEGGREQHDGPTLVVEAYVVVWVVLMGWLLMLWRRQSSMNKRLDGLESAIDRAIAKGGKGDAGTSGR
jgi:CcmD family protein